MSTPSIQPADCLQQTTRAAVELCQTVALSPCCAATNCACCCRVLSVLSLLCPALHNFPEGIAVLLAAHKSNAVGRLGGNRGAGCRGACQQWLVVLRACMDSYFLFD